MAAFLERNDTEEVEAGWAALVAALACLPELAARVVVSLGFDVFLEDFGVHRYFVGHGFLAETVSWP